MFFIFKCSFSWNSKLWTTKVAACFSFITKSFCPHPPSPCPQIHFYLGDIVCKNNYLTIMWKIGKHWCVLYLLIKLFPFIKQVYRFSILPKVSFFHEVCLLSEHQCKMRVVLWLNTINILCRAIHDSVNWNAGYFFNAGYNDDVEFAKDCIIWKLLSAS